MSAVRQGPLRLSPSASLGASAKQGRLSREAREGAHPQLFRVNAQRHPRYSSSLKWPTRPWLYSFRNRKSWPGSECDDDISTGWFWRTRLECSPPAQRATAGYVQQWNCPTQAKRRLEWATRPSPIPLSGPLPRIRSLPKSSDYVNGFPGQHTRC